MKKYLSNSTFFSSMNILENAMKRLIGFLLFSCLSVPSAVLGQAPDWSVNASAYSKSLSFVGVVQFDGVESTDGNDMIGAFVGGECRGVAQPTLFPVTGRWTFGMNIYSNTNGETITFKAYDASGGIVYDAIAENYIFQEDAIIGNDMYPEVLHATYLQYTVTVSSGGHGTVNPSGDQTIRHDGTLSVTATADVGYHFVDWTVTGAISVTVGGETGEFTVMGDGTITANFAINQYTVTVSSGGHGTVNPSGDQTVNHGGTLSVTATPEVGYHFVDWTVTGGVTVTDGDETGEFTVTGTGTVTANFEINQYTVTVSSGGHGTVNPSGDQTVNHGSTLSVTATPEVGYHFVDWTVTGGVSVTDGDETGEFTITGTGTIQANFAINQYTVTVSSGGHGTVNPSGDQTVNHGSTLSVTAAPEVGYHFVDWTVTGGVIVTDGDETGEFTITGAGTIQANFAINQYTVTVTSGGHGTVNPSGDQTVNHGSTISVTATSEAGYHFVDWTVTGGVIVTDGDETGEFTVTGTGTIQANFSMNQYTVTVSSGGHGTVNPSGDQTVNHGGTLSVTATAEVGYIFVNWTVTGGVAITDGNATGQFAITDNGTITANFTNDISILTMAGNPVGTGTTIPALGDTIVIRGTVVSIKAIPTVGCCFVNWTGDGIADPGDQNTTITVDGNKTVTANFVDVDTLTMIVNPLEGGRTVPAVGDTIVAKGSVVPIKAMAEEGYRFLNWSGSGISDVGSWNTTITVDGSRTATALFELIPYYTLSMAVDPAGGGSTVPAVGDTSVLDGSVIDIRALPAVGYSFINWTGTGIASPSNANTTVTVDGDKTVTANFVTYRPDWHLDPQNYQYSMALTCVILFDDVESVDPNDLLGAFVGGECRGVTSPTLFPVTGRYTIGIMVYSNQLSGETVTFKAYDFSNDMVYNTVIETYPFQLDAIIGNDFTPEQLHAVGMVSQEIDFGAGWNWFSLNVTGSDMTLNAVLASLGDKGEFIKDQTAYASYYSGSWYSSNGLDEIDNRKMYMIKMSQESSLQFSGYPVAFQNMPVDLGVGWNWFGYLPQEPNNLNDALESLGGNGYFIKNQHSYAFYYSQHSTWYSSNRLDNMFPGGGYKIKMSAAATLTYGAPAGGLSKVVEGSRSPSGDTDWGVDPHGYDHSMAVTGVVIVNGEESIDENDVVAAFVRDECRGVSRIVCFPLNQRYEFGMLVYGTEGEEIIFKVYDSSSQSECISVQSISFEVDGIVGDGIKPYILTVYSEEGEQSLEIPKEYYLEQNYPNPFNPETVISFGLPKEGDVSLTIYNTIGQAIRTLVSGRMASGQHRIVWDGLDNDGERVESGIYIYRLITDTFRSTRKMIYIR